MIQKTVNRQNSVVHIDGINITTKNISPLFMENSLKYLKKMFTWSSVARSAVPRIGFIAEVIGKSTKK